MGGIRVNSFSIIILYTFVFPHKILKNISPSLSCCIWFSVHRYTEEVALKLCFTSAVGVGHSLICHWLIQSVSLMIWLLINSQKLTNEPNEQKVFPEASSICTVWMSPLYYIYLLMLYGMLYGMLFFSHPHLKQPQCMLLFSGCCSSSISVIFRVCVILPFPVCWLNLHCMKDCILWMP